MMNQQIDKVNIENVPDPSGIKLEKDPFRPGAYVITLPLDSDPSYVWQALFQQVLWWSLDLWDLKVLIVGRELKLITTPAQLAKKLDWVEKLVTATNAKVDEYNAGVIAAKDAEDSKLMDDALIKSDIARWHLRRVRYP
jgi:hypothetical protein